jgi:hypothetical protein
MSVIAGVLIVTTVSFLSGEQITCLKPFSLILCLHAADHHVTKSRFFLYSTKIMLYGLLLKEVTCLKCSEKEGRGVARGGREYFQNWHCFESTTNCQLIANPF